ncbi:MAG: hypothetical protein IJM45_05525 [Clostridia bacterium]|nr:hypothetical protein [Clostridia bacterium]
MREVLMRIAAFFMSIVTFFAARLGIDIKPQEPDPGPVCADFREAGYDVPAPVCGTAGGIFVSGGGTVICRREGTEDADFDAYVSLLEEQGFNVYSTNRIENNRFATLTKDGTAVTVSRFSKTRTLRVIVEPEGGLCPLTDPYETKCDTLLTGMKGETCVAGEGMGFIIRLADGSFCIIDGGMGDPDHVDSNKLMNILLSQKPADAEKPVIAAWIFTHLHGDHIGVFNCFSLDHHDDVVLERLYFNFPKEEETAKSDSPYMLDDTIYRYTQFKKNLADFYADVPVVKLHSGNRFAVRNADFEVLYAYDDLYPKTILDGGMNENSLLLKMTVGSQSVLWTGDFAFNAADLVLSEYDDALSADILQMAHHGWNGTPELYAAVDPEYALLPVSFECDLDSMFSSAQNAWLKNSPKLRQVIVTFCGTWTVRLPYAPAEGTFERVPSPGTVYPAYPELLGE